MKILLASVTLVTLTTANAKPVNSSLLPNKDVRACVVDNDRNAVFARLDLGDDIIYEIDLIGGEAQGFFIEDNPEFTCDEGNYAAAEILSRTCEVGSKLYVEADDGDDRIFQVVFSVDQESRELTLEDYSIEFIEDNPTTVCL